MTQDVKRHSEKISSVCKLTIKETSYHNSS